MNTNTILISPLCKTNFVTPEGKSLLLLKEDDVYNLHNFVANMLDFNGAIPADGVAPFRNILFQMLDNAITNDNLNDDAGLRSCMVNLVHNVSNVADTLYKILKQSYKAAPRS